MKKGFYVILISLVAIFGFGKQIKRHCAKLMCSEGLKVVGIKFLDTIGNPVVVKDFRALNLRTRESMVIGSVTDTVYSKGDYTIASDLHISKVSDEGIDTIEISGRHPITNALKTARVVVGRDDCDCHVSKLSGPDEVVFN